MWPLRRQRVLVLKTAALAAVTWLVAVHLAGHHSLVPAPGPHWGDLGRPVLLANLTVEQRAQVRRGWELNAFNQYISDLVDVHRALPDVREPGCRTMEYQAVLPRTSVIVCFHNEAWSTLLRTVHSVLERSPSELLEEILLVDDFSTMAHLGKPLEEYVEKLPNVHLLRTSSREGLIRARLLGAARAKGPVLTFLDSHCECTAGWLEPLLDRIARQPTTVVCPVIDVIHDDTLEYVHRSPQLALSVGGFDWNLQFNWHLAPDRVRRLGRNNTWDPVSSPTMAGGLFAIDKAFFERLGSYDSGMDIWGGENLELSFKTWMCGGRLEIVPCSHVGHIFRKRSPYLWRPGVNVLKRNSVRLAKVWLDDFAKYYYQRIGNDLGDFGDVKPRMQLRESLNCKSFQWYLSNVYPEMFVPGEALANGEVRNLGDGGTMCLDSPARKSDLQKPVGIYPCHRQGGNQFWMLSKTGELRRDDVCLDFSGNGSKVPVLYPCHGAKGNQQWKYDSKSLRLLHAASGRCLELLLTTRLVMRPCSSSRRQQWSLENFQHSS